MKANLRSEMQTLLTVETEMLTNWINTNTANAAALANSQPIRECIYELLDTEELSETGKVRADVVENRRKLHHLIGPTLASHNYAGYNVVDKSQRILASTTEDLIGRQAVR